LILPRLREPREENQRGDSHHQSRHFIGMKRFVEEHGVLGTHNAYYFIKLSGCIPVSRRPLVLYHFAAPCRNSQKQKSHSRVEQEWLLYEKIAEGIYSLALLAYQSRYVCRKPLASIGDVYHLYSLPISATGG
jgi:hypothetical protein